MATTSDTSDLTQPLGALVRTWGPFGLAVAGAAWLLFSAQAPPVLETTHGGVTELSPPLQLPAFSLETVGPVAITPDSLKGRWTLLSLGFTSCPDICPTTLSTLSGALSHTGAADGAVQVLFVSVDPERDTPKKLESYASHFGEFVVGATGSHEQLLALTKPLGLFYQREDPGAEPSHYNVQHSTTVLVIGPDAEIVALLRADQIGAVEIGATIAALRARA